jgi:hypothetical protein
MKSCFSHSAIRIKPLPQALEPPEAFVLFLASPRRTDPLVSSMCVTFFGFVTGTYRVFVFSPGSPIEPGFHRRFADFAMFAHIFHEFPLLGVFDSHGIGSLLGSGNYRFFLSGSPRQWGILIVVNGEK